MYKKTVAIAFGILFFGANVVLAGTVSLQWDPNTEADLAGYKLHYGTSSRTVGPYTEMQTIPNKAATSGEVTLEPGVYFFALKAYDVSGLESGFSNEVSAVIPSAQPPGKPGKPILLP